MALVDNKANPYATINEAVKLAEHHAARARYAANRADDDRENDHESVVTWSARAQAHAAAATATMVASGCTQIQDLKR